jgi:hypothetical protein
MSDPVVETPLAVGGLGIQHRVILRPNKADLLFSVAIDSTAAREDIYLLMDTISAVADRERLKTELVEKQEALRVAKEQPEAALREVARLEAQRAGFIASHETMRENRRLPWKPNEKQRQALEQFDAQIEGAKLSRKSFMHDIPVIEWEIVSLEARIAGREPPERPAEIVDAMQEIVIADAAE